MTEKGRKRRLQRPAEPKREPGGLSETPHQLVAILADMNEGIYVADPVTHEVLYANEIAKSQFGRDIVGKKCHETLQGQKEPCPFCTNAIIFGENGGKAHIWEFQNRRNQRWYRCIDKAIPWNDGRLVRSEVALDIHERKVAEEALQASERKYRQLVENIHEVTYVINRDGIVDYVSPAIRALTGFSPEELQGRPFAPYIHEDDYDRIVVRFSNALSGQAKATEYRILKKSGEYVWVRTYSKPIRQGREVLGLQGVLSDISSLKEMENELREREKELSRKTKDLEEVNTALQVLLRAREGDKENLEEQVLLNLKNLVIPYVEKLRKVEGGRKRKAYLDAVEANLRTITSSFSRDLSFRYRNLTPTEVRVAALIKGGKSTKEIAELMTLSDRTIESHRKNLRRKMGLKDRKANLRTTLMCIV